MLYMMEKIFNFNFKISCFVTCPNIKIPLSQTVLNHASNLNFLSNFSLLSISSCNSFLFKCKDSLFCLFIMQFAMSSSSRIFITLCLYIFFSFFLLFLNSPPKKFPLFVEHDLILFLKIYFVVVLKSNFHHYCYVSTPMEI